MNKLPKNFGKMKKPKNEIYLRGSRTKGWVIYVEDDTGYYADFPLTHLEALELRNLLMVKVK